MIFTCIYHHLPVFSTHVPNIFLCSLHNHFLGTFRTRIGFLPQKTGIRQGKRHGQMMSKEADLAHSRKLRQESEGQQLRRKKAAIFLGGHGHCPMVKMGGEIASDISDISALYSINDDGIYIYMYWLWRDSRDLVAIRWFDGIFDGISNGIL